MNNALFKDTPTSHRVLDGGRLRVVYARHDWEGNFVRFVVLRTEAEVEKIRKSYGRLKIGIPTWYEVWEHNFAAKPTNTEKS